MDTPESWESSFNVSAPEFVPNVNAAEFVPSFCQPAEPVISQEAAIDETANMMADASLDASSSNGVQVDEQALECTDRVDVENDVVEEEESASSTPVVSKKKKVDMSNITMDERSHLNIVFIGHVDAGKSTIGGHIMFLTGQVDKRTLEKYEREAKEKNRETWFLSWALDTNQEERDKGKTVECGRAYFDTEKKRFTILDAPGHKSFVPNMISGAAQADVAVLVISARRGEFETGFERGGQTREHAMLVKTAGIKNMVIVINKMDDITVKWDKGRYDEIVGKLTPFLRKVGYNPKTDLTWMPVSGQKGTNLKDRSPKGVCDWYTGPALLEWLDNFDVGTRRADDPVRVPISEKYRDMGTVVMGKLEAGRVFKGQSLMIMPNRQNVEILTVWSDETEVEGATAGDNLKMKLRGIEEEDISIGFAICDPERPINVVRVFDAQIVILDLKHIICAGYSAVMHIHTCVEEVVMTQLLYQVDRKTGKKYREPPRFLKQDMVAIARFETAGPICAERFSDFPQLGRFNLRDEGKTVAIGKILKLVKCNDDAYYKEDGAPVEV